MKKKLISLLLLCLLLTLLCPLTAFAEAAEAAEPAQDFPYVLDNAGLLNDSQRQRLEETAAAYSEAHGCGLYVVTMEDYNAFAGDVYTCATGIFEYYKLGLGDSRDGVILVLSMKQRDYALAGHGDKGETICGYESSWLLEDEFLDNFKKKLIQHLKSIKKTSMHLQNGLIETLKW